MQTRREKWHKIRDEYRVQLYRKLRERDDAAMLACTSTATSPHGSSELQELDQPEKPGLLQQPRLWPTG
jgi:hypothetical protein